MRDGRLLTSGGRVLCVTALGESVKLAQARAYEGLRGIHFEGAQLRHDLGRFERLRLQHWHAGRVRQCELLDR